MTKKFLKCATSFLLTLSLLLSMTPLLVGAEEKDTSQQIEVASENIIDSGITPTPIEPTPEEETELLAVSGTQSANKDPSSFYYAGEIIYEDPDDPYADFYEYLDSSATTIPDGVYSIESLAYEMFGMYNLYSLHEPYGDDFILQLWDYQWVIPVDVYDIYGSFKITKKPNTDYYVIRWMSNNRYGFTGEGGSLALKALPYNDADVSLADTFSITYDGGGFVIKPYGSSAAISIPATADPYVGPELALENPSTAGPLARWNLILYTGPDYHGFFMEGDTAGLRDGICAGESHSIKIFGTSTDPYTNEVTVTATVTQATLTWNSQTQTMTLDAHRAPIFTFFIQTINSATQSRSCRFRRDVYIYLPINNGVYYIKNKSAGTVAQSYYIHVTNSNSGSELSLFEAMPSNQYRWWIEHDTDGYYKIKSYESNMVLSVPTNAANTAGVHLIQSTDTQHPGQRFKMEQTASGGYVLRPKSAENASADFCLARTTFFGMPDLIQGTYTNDSSYEDEWLFYPCDDYMHTYVGDYVGDPNMPALLENVESLFLQSMRFGYGNLSVAENEFYRQMSTSEIVTMIAHGNKNGIVLNSEPKEDKSASVEQTVYAPEANIGIYDIKSCNLQNVKLVCLGSCNTGEDGVAGREQAILNGDVQNFAEAFYYSGADVVVSYKTKIFFSEIQFWLESFMIYIKNGSTVESALTLADEALEDYYFAVHQTTPPAICEENRYVIGDQSLVPCPN